MSRQIARGTGVLGRSRHRNRLSACSERCGASLNAFIGISEAHTTNLAVSRRVSPSPARNRRWGLGGGDPRGGDLQSSDTGRSRPIARCSATPRRRCCFLISREAIAATFESRGLRSE